MIDVKLARCINSTSVTYGIAPPDTRGSQPCSSCYSLPADPASQPADPIDPAPEPADSIDPAPRPADHIDPAPRPADPGDPASRPADPATRPADPAGFCYSTSCSFRY